MTNEQAQEPRQGRPRGQTRTCDFCGKPAATVRRVALDRDYERLRTPHRELYACPECSDAKERRRRGLEPR